jgi:hypothetical protein
MPGNVYKGVGEAYTATREGARTLKRKTGEAYARAKEIAEDTGAAAKQLSDATGATYVGTKAAQAARELYKRQDYKRALRSAKALTTDNFKEQRAARKASMLVSAEKEVKNAKEALRKVEEDYAFTRRRRCSPKRGATTSAWKVRAAQDNVRKKEEFFQKMRQANPDVSFGGGTNEEEKEEKEKKKKRRPKPTTLKAGYPRSRRAANSKAKKAKSKAKTRKGRRRFSHSYSMVH